MSEKGSVTPEELDFEDDDSVEKIGDDRYIISPDPNTSPDAPDDPEKVDEELGDQEDEEHELEGDYVYQLTIGGQFDGKTVTYIIEENDIVSAFDELLKWYAQEVKETGGHDKEAAEIIEQLIAHSETLEKHR